MTDLTKYIRVEDLARDQYKPDGENHPTIYECALTKQERFLPEIVALKGIDNCNGESTGINSTGDIWTPSIVVSTVSAGNGIYTTESIRNGYLTAGKVIEVNRVENEDRRNASTLEITADYHESERDRIQELYNQSAEDLKASLNRAVMLFKSLKLNGEARKLLANPDNTEKARYCLSAKYPNNIHTIDKILKDHETTLRRVGKYRKPLEEDSFGEGIFVYDFLNKGTIIKIGGIEREITTDIEVPETQVYRIRKIGKKLKLDFRDLPDDFISLEDRLPQ